MSDPRIIPYSADHRVETGPVQFGDDWPGLFIRGDDALAYASAVHDALNDVTDPLTSMYLREMLGLLRAVRVRATDKQDVHGK